MAGASAAQPCMQPRATARMTARTTARAMMDHAGCERATAHSGSHLGGRRRATDQTRAKATDQTRAKAVYADQPQRPAYKRAARRRQASDSAERRWVSHREDGHGRDAPGGRARAHPLDSSRRAEGSDVAHSGSAFGDSAGAPLWSALVSRTVEGGSMLHKIEFVRTADRRTYRARA